MEIAKFPDCLAGIGSCTFLLSGFLLNNIYWIKKKITGRIGTSENIRILSGFCPDFVRILNVEKSRQ